MTLSAPVSWDSRSPIWTHLGDEWGSPSFPEGSPAEPLPRWGPLCAGGHPEPGRGGQLRPQHRPLPAAPSGSGPSVPSQKKPPARWEPLSVPQHPPRAALCHPITSTLARTVLPHLSYPHLFPPNPISICPSHLQVRREHVFQFALFPRTAFLLLVPLSRAWIQATLCREIPWSSYEQHYHPCYHLFSRLQEELSDGALTALQNAPSSLSPSLGMGGTP